MKGLHENCLSVPAPPDEPTLVNAVVYWSDEDDTVAAGSWLVVVACNCNVDTDSSPNTSLLRWLGVECRSDVVRGVSREDNEDEEDMDVEREPAIRTSTIPEKGYRGHRYISRKHKISIAHQHQKIIFRNTISSCTFEERRGR